MQEIKMLTKRERIILESTVYNNLHERIKKRVMKGVEEDTIEQLLIFHIRLYLEAVRTCLIRKTKNCRRLSAKDINEVFTEILQR